jgi:hypothetical protein
MYTRDPLGVNTLKITYMIEKKAIVYLVCVKYPPVALIHMVPGHHHYVEHISYVSKVFASCVQNLGGIHEV